MWCCFGVGGGSSGGRDGRCSRLGVLIGWIDVGCDMQDTSYQIDLYGCYWWRFGRFIEVELLVRYLVDQVEICCHSGACDHNIKCPCWRELDSCFEGFDLIFPACDVALNVSYSFTSVWETRHDLIAFAGWCYVDHHNVRFCHSKSLSDGQTEPACCTCNETYSISELCSVNCWRRRGII